MNLNVIVLAAGQGKRMHSDTPKVLHTLAGRSLLGRVVDTAHALGAARIFAVYGHGGDTVPRAFAAEPGLVWVEQREQLGTGHAVMQALPQIDPAANVLVLYGDVPLITDESLQRLVDAAEPGLAIMSAEFPDPSGYGRIVRDRMGQITHIVEHKDASAAERLIREVNTGFLAANACRLAGWLERVRNDNAQEEYYLTDVVGLAVADGVPVQAVQPAELWEVAGVNSKRELAELERIHRRTVANQLLEAGVTLADAARIDVRGTLACGRDVSIDVNCVFEGGVRLGARVRIGPNCILRNVTVEADTEIHAFTLIEDAAVGARCRIGPYARLRPGAALGEDVHIGNFVEVKNSRFGAGSKANHLAYVGDSTVGSRVNIGAGTITCNYDGVNKNRTTIEDEAFIGSDTQLVAPVRVGRGANIGAGTITCNYDGVNKNRTTIEDDCFIGSDATLVAPVTIAKGSYIGAGSTISRDTPPGQLTVARARQVSIPSWKPPKKNDKEGA